ncbi:hypothetical protein ACOMHN_019707 [Nucella lapillus]
MPGTETEDLTREGFEKKMRSRMFMKRVGEWWTCDQNGCKGSRCILWRLRYQRLKTLIEDEYDKDVEVTGEGTPTTTGFLEVSVNGQLVHSKKNGDGYVDNKAKENKILDAIGQALGQKK